MSRHANVRAQQRGIPPLIDQMLDMYGEEQYDGHGGVLVFLTKQSIRCAEKDWGREPIRRMAEWLDSYKVRDSHDGTTITAGIRYQRIRRK